MAKNELPLKESKPLGSNHPEVMGVALIITSLLIYLSLFSFRESIPSTNWLGQVGYYSAWTLLYAFGLLCYPLNLILIWVGWSKLTHKEIEHKTTKAVHFWIMSFSICMLISVFAETHPSFAALFNRFVYSEKVNLLTPLSYKTVRYYLGGFPAYYLYTDLPNFNLLHLLSNIGVTLVFMTTLLTSFLLLTQYKISSLIAYLQVKFQPTESSQSQSAPKKALLSTLLLKGMKKIKSLLPTTKIESEITSIKQPPDHFSPFEMRKEPLTTRYEPKVHTSFETPSASIYAPEQPNLAPSISNYDYAPQVAQKLASKRERAIEQQRVYNGDFKNYKLPSPNLLTQPKRLHQPTLKNDLRKQAELLEETLLSFGIEAKVGEIHCGPTIVSFEVHPATGVKVQKIKALENDIALNLQAKSIRIIAPIPGKAVVGIEIPAAEAQEVSFKESLEDYLKSQRKFNIPVLLGQTVNGEQVMTDLVRMPHCIIAGATGTGKSVCINSIVMSMLMNCKPDEVKLLLVDPKKVELSPYTKLPHMLAPVITEPQGVISALKWLVKEMEHRYEVLKLLGLRNIASFNTRALNKEFEDSLDIEIPGKMYYIVCIIDELADLMMLSSNEIEVPIARIAQMARAVGIHLILATQRPSREVITGLIKANFPTRVSFKVASRVNSQIILDEIGAESLLGNGDMLFMPPGAASLIRTQGCFIYDQDVHKVVEEICRQSPPNYLIDSFDHMEPKVETLGGGEVPHHLAPSGGSDLDPLYDQALDLVMKTGSISTTFIQRKLKIGYARAASIVDQLEAQGLISAQDGSKPRKLLLSSKRDDEEFSLNDTE